MKGSVEGVGDRQIYKTKLKLYFRKNLVKTPTLRTEHFSRRMQREKSITNRGEENRMVVESPETALKGHSHAKVYFKKKL